MHEQVLESNVAPRRVWAVWSNPESWSGWNPDVRSITLDGPFASGTTGSMTTGNGAHSIRLENVVEGRSFDLVTSPIPATTFRFHCEVQPLGAGSRVSQGVEMSGLLGPIVSLLMGKRIAQSFAPILAGLTAEAQRAGDN